MADAPTMAESHDPAAQDVQLLRDFARGRRQAFDPLVQRHGADIKAYALRMLRSAEQAEEVYVEAFTKLARQSQDWKDTGTVRGFLFTAAHRQCLDILRRRKTEREATPQLIDLERTRTFQPSPEATTMLGELADELERAVAELPEEHRQVLLLRTVHGLSAEETAAVVGLAPSQVHSRLSYARREVRGKLQRPQAPAKTTRDRRRNHEPG